MSEDSDGYFFWGNNGTGNRTLFFCSARPFSRTAMIVVSYEERVYFLLDSIESRNARDGAREIAAAPLLRFSVLCAASRLCSMRYCSFGDCCWRNRWRREFSMYLGALCKQLSVFGAVYIVNICIGGFHGAY